MLVRLLGIGDYFRQEKGRGSYGTFSVAGVDHDGSMLSDQQEIWDDITREGQVGSGVSD